jgi:hypothetical protein
MREGKAMSNNFDVKSNNFDVKSNNEIEEMAKAVCVNCMDEVCASGRCAFQWDCPLSMETIKKLYNAGYRKQSEWISVEDRLPEMDNLCLLSMENRITKYRWVVIGYYHTNYDEYVTHWMPLPEAPKMKGGAE